MNKDIQRNCTKQVLKVFAVPSNASLILLAPVRYSSVYVVKQKCTATDAVKYYFGDPICLLDIADVERLFSTAPLSGEFVPA